MNGLSGTTIILRLEGLALAIACIWLFALFHQSWWLFAALFLAPDLSMLAYFAGPRIGAAVYNFVHSWVTAVGLFFLAFYAGDGSPLLLSLPFILGAHIGVDRALGFGLKHRTGFRDTHLGRLGRAA